MDAPVSVEEDREPFVVDVGRLQEAIEAMGQCVHELHDADPLHAALRRVELAFAEHLERCRAQADACAHAARVRDEAMATVGHELRNPLSTIATALEVLRHQPSTRAVLSGDRTFRIVREQVSHATRLLDDLLQTWRDASMRIDLVPCSVAVEALAEQAVLAVEERVRARRQHLTLSLPPHEVHVRADAGRLLQVLVNLLDNASKYTQDGGRIGLRVDAEPRVCVMRVWDEGIGIGSDEVAALRAAFTQGRGLPGRVPSGMGIGLGLVARIVELHGGQLEIVSRDQGRPRGTEVVVRIDREPPAPS